MRSTYFDMMEISAHSAYGQYAGERTRIPTLIPVCRRSPDAAICERRCGPEISSVAMLTTIASRVLW